MKQSLFIGLLALSASAGALAHAVPTHQNITAAAVDYLSKVDPTFSCGSGLNDALQPGTAHEDDDPRYIWHFTPALTAANSTCSSVQWGFGAGACQFSKVGVTVSTTNTHRWPDAVTKSQGQNGTATKAGLNDLGYVIHLLEDLTSPAHTRDDAHPPGDGDPVEAITRIPVVPPTSDGLITFSSAEDAFTQLQAYTSSNFYSKDTAFSGTGPVSVRSDANYFYDARGRAIAYKGSYYTAKDIVGAATPQDATINDVIATAQFTELGPVAVKYVASFIKLYIELTKTPVDACFIDFEKFPGGPVFTSVQAPLSVEGAIVSGGQILKGTTNLPRDQTTVYGTASFCSGCLNNITVSLNAPADGVELLLMNGLTSTTSYTVLNDKGESQTVTLPPNLSSGAAIVNLVAKGIKQVNITTGSTSLFDFFIDNIQLGLGSSGPPPNGTLKASVTFMPVEGKNGLLGAPRPTGAATPDR